MPLASRQCIEVPCALSRALELEPRYDSPLTPPTPPPPPSKRGAKSKAAQPAGPPAAPKPKAKRGGKKAGGSASNTPAAAAAPPAPPPPPQQGSSPAPTPASGRRRRRLLPVGEACGGRSPSDSSRGATAPPLRPEAAGGPAAKRPAAPRPGSTANTATAPTPCVTARSLPADAPPDSDSSSQECFLPSDTEGCRAARRAAAAAPAMRPPAGGRRRGGAARDAAVAVAAPPQQCRKRKVLESEEPVQQQQGDTDSEAQWRRGRAARRRFQERRVLRKAAQQEQQQRQQRPPARSESLVCEFWKSAACQTDPPPVDLDAPLHLTPLQIPGVKLSAAAVPAPAPPAPAPPLQQVAECPRCCRLISAVDEAQHLRLCCATTTTDAAAASSSAPRCARGARRKSHSQGAEVSLACGTTAADLDSSRGFSSSSTGVEVSVACGTEAAPRGPGSCVASAPSDWAVGAGHSGGCVPSSPPDSSAASGPAGGVGAEPPQQQLGAIRSFCEARLSDGDARRIAELVQRHPRLLRQIYRFLWERYGAPEGAEQLPRPAGVSHADRLEAFGLEKQTGWTAAQRQAMLAEAAGREEAMFLKLEARHGAQVVPLEQFGSVWGCAGVWRALYGLLERWQPEAVGQVAEKLACAGPCAGQLYRAVEEHCVQPPVTEEVVKGRERRLVACVERHCPGMLGHVPQLLEKYSEGFEAWFYNTLIALAARGIASFEGLDE